MADKKYAIDKIRNIGIIAHIDAGRPQLLKVSFIELA